MTIKLPPSTQDSHQHGHRFQSQEENRSPGLGPQARPPRRKINAANTSLRSKFRTVVKNVQKALDKAAAPGGYKAAPASLFKTAQSVIDSIADKGIFHKNKAARHKSRLSAKIKALSASAAA